MDSDGCKQFVNNVGALLVNDTVLQQEMADSLDHEEFCTNADFVPATFAAYCQSFLSPIAKAGIKVFGEAITDEAANFCH